jgi:hypothetical protein
MVADERSEEMRRVVLMALGVILALALAAPVALGQPGQGSTSTEASSKLAAGWWQWGLSKPLDTNPLFDSYTGGPQCDGQPLTDTLSKEWFLGGSLGGGAVERTCTVPTGTQLFFPAFNIAVIRNPADPGDTEAHLFDQAHGYVDATVADPDFSMVVTVDGKAVPKKNIVRAEAGLFSGKSPLLVSETNPSGSYEAVADGYWVTLPALSRGKHTIAWKVSAPNADTDPFTEGVQHFAAQDITYHLTIK